jgi:phosphoribosyl 1,2-cyclic phosphate phosphodiesterase
MSSALSASLSPPLQITFLGTGTSTGVPSIGCTCAVCRSSDPRNKRLRPSISVKVLAGEFTGATILVDTTPDMRTQVLRAGITRLDAVLITHTHADHIFGMDDIRQFNFHQKQRIPVYGTPTTLDYLCRVFSYCFTQTQEGGGKPQIDLNPIAIGESFIVCGVTVTPLTVLHGTFPVTAFKFGDHFAYVTDVSAIPEETQSLLTGLETLVLGTVRYDPHPTHFGLHQAVEAAQGLGVRQTYFTHLSHHFDHATLQSELPSGIAPAYDGLQLTVG